MDKKYTNFVREWKHLCSLYQRLLWDCKPSLLVEDMRMAGLPEDAELTAILNHWLLEFDQAFEHFVAVEVQSKQDPNSNLSELAADCWTLHCHSKIDFVKVMNKALSEPDARLLRSHFVNHCKTIAGKGREHFLYADGVHPKCILMIKRWSSLYKSIRAARQELQADVDILSDEFISRVAKKQHDSQQHAKHDDIREAICFLYMGEESLYTELDETDQHVVSSFHSTKQETTLFDSPHSVSFEQVDYLEAVEEQSLRLEGCMKKLETESVEQFQAIQIGHFESESHWGVSTKIANALKCSHKKATRMLMKGIDALRQCMKLSSLTSISKNGSQ
ncbi:hypothetical protein Q8W40_18575 [Vibrio penaeicida]|uniref:hypothetical protein n=1 Tax=Vibrio penaeicida TaxID=104609 RepID=UPI002732ED37|nr:hypothetical protein [Vibrio penaeicida]MDP2574202.1 hypothetical protein [Vibrio penaeicida]